MPEVPQARYIGRFSYDGVPPLLPSDYEDYAELSLPQTVPTSWGSPPLPVIQQSRFSRDTLRTDYRFDNYQSEQLPRYHDDQSLYHTEVALDLFAPYRRIVDPPVVQMASSVLLGVRDDSGNDGTASHNPERERATNVIHASLVPQAARHAVSPLTRREFFDSFYHLNFAQNGSLDPTLANKQNTFGPGHGTTIEQARYKVKNQRWTNSQQIVRIEFRADGRDGVRLGHSADLDALEDGHEEISIGGRGAKICYRIQFPGGYPPFHEQKNITVHHEHGDLHRVLTRAKIVQHVTEAMDKFIKTLILRRIADTRSEELA
ncbi:hypothetical protein PHLCEN_2v11279 [Hermanssonia centrifuga]|uniref:Uncharacterized protein n=1 Tax=Hermanssonia centrifuga TaxID=98765 RepID=A0A2R6NLG8_9APHY|nr:hypothetical protein PHLCEN_2v11279 [Hermanssonia centrifuga]